jgi:hypothetical protein
MIKSVVRMKRSVIVGVLVLMIFLTMTITFANGSGDVAYIYRKDFRIDDNIIDLFEEMGFSVDLINEKEMPADFSGYSLIFAGDENYREELPVGEIPSVVVSYYHGDTYGLTDRDGVRQLGATSPLTVVKDGEFIQVYTKAFKRGRIAVPYYYLDVHNQLPEVSRVATTRPTASGIDFGSVIAHRDNICFFGIVASDYWTLEARELFMECVQSVVVEQQEPPEDPGNETGNETEIMCFDDNSCPEDFMSSPYCAIGTVEYDSNVYAVLTDYSCLSPGIPESECVFNESEILIEDCNFGCFDGECLLGGGIHDVSLINFSDSVDNIKIETQDGQTIFNENLQCNQKYKVIVTVENKGDFAEDVSFDGSVDGLDFNHLVISDFQPGEIKEKTKTVNFSVTDVGDYYNITVEAMIDGFIDINPDDNIASRKVFVNCNPLQ